MLSRLVIIVVLFTSMRVFCAEPLPFKIYPMGNYVSYDAELIGGQFTSVEWEIEKIGRKTIMVDDEVASAIISLRNMQSRGFFGVKRTFTGGSYILLNEVALVLRGEPAVYGVGNVYSWHVEDSGGEETQYLAEESIFVPLEIINNDRRALDMGQVHKAPFSANFGKVQFGVVVVDLYEETNDGGEDKEIMSRFVSSRNLDQLVQSKKPGSLTVYKAPLAFLIKITRLQDIDFLDSVGPGDFEDMLDYSMLEPETINKLKGKDRETVIKQLRKKLPKKTPVKGPHVAYPHTGIFWRCLSVFGRLNPLPFWRG